MGDEKKVNLFIVGAMKSGTTSLVEAIATHPEIYVGPVKEPHFFVKKMSSKLYEPSRFFDLNKYLEQQFPDPLHITNILNENDYHKIYSLAKNERYKVDASTAYLHEPNSVNLIKAYNPEATILVLLRNPLQRAFSHYKMDLGKARTKSSFEDAILENIKEYNEGNLSWDSYLGMSFYDMPLEKFKNNFKNVLVFYFEDFVKNPQDVFNSITEELHLQPLNIESFEKKNESRSMKFQKLFFLLKKMGFKDLFSKIFSTSFKQKIYKWVSSDYKTELQLTDNTKAEVLKLFKKESSKWGY